MEEMSLILKLCYFAFIVSDLNIKNDNAHALSSYCYIYAHVICKVVVNESLFLSFSQATNAKCSPI